MHADCKTRLRANISIHELENVGCHRSRASNVLCRSVWPCRTSKTASQLYDSIVLLQITSALAFGPFLECGLEMAAPHVVVSPGVDDCHRSAPNPEGRLEALIQHPGELRDRRRRHVLVDVALDPRQTLVGESDVGQVVAQQHLLD